MKQAWKRPARASSRTRRTVEHRTNVQRTALADSSAAGMRVERTTSRRLGSSEDG